MRVAAGRVVRAQRSMRGICPAASAMFFSCGGPLFAAPPPESAAASRGGAVRRAFPGEELRRRTGAGNRHFPTAGRIAIQNHLNRHKVRFCVDLYVINYYNVPSGTAIRGSCPQGGADDGDTIIRVPMCVRAAGPERLIREGATAPRDECGRDRCVGPGGKCGMAAGQGHGSGGQGVKQLRNAVAKGSAERVAELLRQGTDPGTRDCRGVAGI